MDRLLKEKSPNNSLNSISTKDSCSISTDFANAGPGTYRISEGRAFLTKIVTDNVGAVKESLKNGDYLTSTNYSTNVNLKELVPTKIKKSRLHPWFLTGFIDAEGCFMFNIVRNNKIQVG